MGAITKDGRVQMIYNLRSKARNEFARVRSPSSQSPCPNVASVTNSPLNTSPARRHLQLPALDYGLQIQQAWCLCLLNPHKGPARPSPAQHFIMLGLKWPLKSQIIFYLPFFSHLLLNVNEGKGFKSLLIKHFNWLKYSHNCKLFTFTQTTSELPFPPTLIPGHGLCNLGSWQQMPFLCHLQLAKCHLQDRQPKVSDVPQFSRIGLLSPNIEIL